MHGDQDVGIPLAGRRDDGEWVRSGEGVKFREIGELLLRVDEMEDTLRLMEADRAPEVGERYGSLARLAERIRVERAKIEALERRGGIRYDEVERAIRLSEVMG